MTNDEIKNKQEETLNNLKKYNESRKTEIVDEPNEDVLTTFERAERGVPKPPMQEWLDEQDRLSEEMGITVIYETEPDAEEKMIMSHICPYCGTMAYIGQIHGLGYCKEKPQYQE